jgi:hypothetical protein
MATYFQINLRGGATRVIATTEEVAMELNSLNAKLRSYGSCPCNKAAKQQTKAKMQELLLGSGRVIVPDELIPATIPVTQLPETWELSSD